MAKRPHGTGSIYKRPNGKWRILVTDINGKRISKTVKTQQDAYAYARKMTQQIEQGLTYENAQVTLKQFIKDWLNIKENKLRPATMEQYRRLVRLYIDPGLGSFALKDINGARVQAFYNDMQKRGVGRRTGVIVHTVLHGCLKHALRLGMVSRNWCALVEVPRPQKQEMQVWDESQVNAFISQTPNQVFYRMAFSTGMRRGELIGLQWQDLDWQAETIRVSRQVYEVPGGGFKFQEPKTARGRRLIRLGHSLIETLREHYNKSLPLARALAGDRWKEHELIFPSSVGTPRFGYEVSKEFKKLAVLAGLPPIRFHDIRHTAASIMLLHGEPPVRVAGILGQSVAVLLDTYAHYLPDDQERAAALMDEITTPIVFELNQIKEKEQINSKITQ